MNQTATKETIRFSCPNCGTRARVPVHHAGKRGKCHSCRQVIQIPAPRPKAPEWANELADDLAWDALLDDATSHLASATPARAPARAPARTPAPALSLAPPAERTPRARSRARRVPCVECGLLFSGEGMLCSDCTAPAEAPRSSHGRGRGQRLAEPRDLPTEEHLRAVAFWQFLPSVLVAIVALVGGMKVGGVLAIPVVVAVFLPGCAAAFALGYSLWSYQSWCRWVNVAMSASFLTLGLAALVLSGFNTWALIGMILLTAWHGSLLYLLVTKGHVFDLDYSQAAARSRVTVAIWRSPLFWIPIGLLTVSGVILASQVSTLLGALRFFG
jgi:hypothetical protein